MNILVITLLAVLLCTYIPNSGGSGVALPYNLSFMLWLGVTLLLLAWRQIRITTSAQRQPIIIAGSILLLFPWMLHINTDLSVLTLVVGLFLWWVLTSLPLTLEHKNNLLAIIFILAVCQAVLGLIQTFFPSIAGQWMEYNWLRNHGRPYGIFQQINLFASFLASGAGCGFFLLISRTRLRYTSLYISGLGILSLMLAINQSRVGAIGALVTVFIMTWLHWRESWRYSLTALGVMASSSFAGWYISQHLHILVNGVPYLMARDYLHSNTERWNILRITWHMILEKPWSGWGYGRFEYDFSRWVIAHPDQHYTYSSIVTHPHNELLYAWFQGGILALAGILMLLVGWICMIICAFKVNRTNGAYTLLIIPLITHLNLEYPFYQSFVHFVLFLVLLRLGITDRPYTGKSTLWIRGCYGLMGIALVGYGCGGLLANNRMTTLERNNLVNFPDPAPWYFATLGKRNDFDQMVSLLMYYNQSRDPAYLGRFFVQAEKWSQTHNDRNIWLSMIAITRYRGDSKKLADLQLMYDKLFPCAPTLPLNGDGNCSTSR